MAMAATKVWTLAELDALPEDGNRYELVYGELLVTPGPGPSHEDIAGELNAILVPYVAAERLGRVYLPRGVVQHAGSQVEPDLQVRQPLDVSATWDKQPVPILVIEILSPSNRAADRALKRRFYHEVGVAEYWIVDPVRRTVTSVRRDRGDLEMTETVTWRPEGATRDLVIDLRELFG